MRGIHLPVFMTYYYTVLVIKTVQYWQKCRLIGQCDRIDSPEIYAHKYAHCVLQKYKAFKGGWAFQQMDPATIVQS